MHSDEAAGATGGPGGDEFFLQDEGFAAALGQVEGEAGPVNAAPNDDDIGCVIHDVALLCEIDTDKINTDKRKHGWGWVNFPEFLEFLWFLWNRYGLEKHG